jgi:hypothetical protein
MHSDIEIRPSVGSLATNIRDWVSQRAAKIQRRISSLVNTPKKCIGAKLSAGGMHNMIPPGTVLAGAVAFGFWWNSVSAGLFAGSALFFMACIYKALRQIVAIFRWERDRAVALNSNWNTAGTVERSERNLEVGTRAIERLRPWVEDATPLTEENAKAYCSVLLDTLAALHPKFAE